MSIHSVSIPWPYRKPQHAPIVPVFLPFAGCRTRCIYCAQNIQTGQGAHTPPAAVLDACDGMLAFRKQRGLPPCGLAFFGRPGTLPREGPGLARERTHHRLEMLNPARLPFRPAPRPYAQLRMPHGRTRYPEF